MPRKELLPPYLDNETWRDFCDAIDSVFKENVDEPTIALSKYRDLWQLSPAAIAKIESEYQDGTLLDDSAWLEREWSHLVMDARSKGFFMPQSDAITDEAYKTVVRFISQYWFSKGTPELTSFIGFILGAEIVLRPLWAKTDNTRQYIDLLPESSLTNPDKILNGGPYFPTTHVELVVDPLTYNSADTPKIVNLFYAIANYNLVLAQMALEVTSDVSSLQIPGIDPGTISIFPPYSSWQAGVAPDAASGWSLGTLAGKSEMVMATLPNGQQEVMWREQQTNPPANTSFDLDVRSSHEPTPAVNQGLLYAFLVKIETYNTSSVESYIRVGVPSNVLSLAGGAPSATAMKQSLTSIGVGEFKLMAFYFHPSTYAGSGANISGIYRMDNVRQTGLLEAKLSPTPGPFKGEIRSVNDEAMTGSRSVLIGRPVAIPCSAAVAPQIISYLIRQATYIGPGAYFTMPVLLDLEYSAISRRPV